MPLTVVLAVGMDSWKLTAQSSVWRSQGLIVISAGSINEAISHFRAGDFDLVLLDQSISPASSDRLTFLIRASGSLTPVVCLAGIASDCHAFEDSTLGNGNDSNQLIADMKELLTKKARVREAQKPAREDAA